jgi:hypothetical protein
MIKEKKETKCDDLIDVLLEEQGISQEAVLGENGLIAQLKKRVVERALAGELTHHLGYAKGEAPEEIENHRNGYSKKRVVGEDGAMEMELARDRSGSFEPLLIAKGQQRFEGFEEKIIAMYARGMTVREIEGFLLDHYKVEVSADFISAVTDSVIVVGGFGGVASCVVVSCCAARCRWRRWQMLLGSTTLGSGAWRPIMLKRPTPRTRGRRCERSRLTKPVPGEAIVT